MSTSLEIAGRRGASKVRVLAEEIAVVTPPLIAMFRRLIEGERVASAEKMSTLTNAYRVVNVHPSVGHRCLDIVRGALQDTLREKIDTLLTASAGAEAAAAANDGDGGDGGGDGGLRQNQIAALQNAIQELKRDRGGVHDSEFRALSAVTRILDSRETDWSGIPLNVAHPSTMQPTASTIQSSRDCGLGSVVGGGTCAPTVSDGDDDSDGGARTPGSDSAGGVDDVENEAKARIDEDGDDE